MNRLKKHFPSLLNWVFWVLLFILFSWWHGAFEPPLSEEEINVFAQKLHIGNPERTVDEYRQLLVNDTGEPIYMVNVIKYFDNPVITENARDSIEAEKLVKTYNNYVGKFLIQRGSYPIFLGKALGGTAAAWGVDEEDAAGWSEAAIVRYRNIRTMMELATDEQFNQNLDFKHAALQKTIIYPTEARINTGGLSLIVFFMILSAALISQLFINQMSKKLTLL